MTIAFQLDAFQSNFVQDTAGSLAGVVALTLSGGGNCGGWKERSAGVKLRRFVNLSESFEYISQPTTYAQIAGSSTLTFAGTNAILAVRAASGSAAFTFTPVISLSGALAGASDLSLTAASTLVGSGALAGPAVATLTSVGGVTGVASIAGACAVTIDAMVSSSGVAVAAMVFGGSPFLMGYAPITGISDSYFQRIVTPTLSRASAPGLAALTFGGTNSLINVGAKGVLRRLDDYRDQQYAPFRRVSNKYRFPNTAGGIASITITPSAPLTAKGALAGSADITVGATSTLPANGALAGAAAVTISGNLFSSGSGSVTGTASITFGGIVGASGAMAGSADLVFGSGSSALTGVGGMATSAPMVFGSLASLTPTGMFGQANISFNVEMGPRWRGLAFPLSHGYGFYQQMAQVYLSKWNKNATQLIAIGQLSIAFTPVAELLGTGTLAGTATLTFDSNVSAQGASSGQTDINFFINATPRADGALAGAAGMVFGEGNTGLFQQIPLTASEGMQFTLSAIIQGLGEWVKETPNSGSGWTTQGSSTGSWIKQSQTDGTWIKQTGT